MPLSKKFRETIRDRAQSSKILRDGMLLDVINTLLEGDTELTKIALRNYINATIGFEPPAEATNTNPKSLHRMLGQSGNPSFEQLLLMLKTLQDHAGINIQAKKTKPGPQNASPALSQYSRHYFDGSITLSIT